MKFFKKYILLLLSSILVFSSCVQKSKSDEKVVDYFKNMKSYKCKVTINLYNDRQNNKYECTLYYDSEKGSRVEVEKDRVLIYKEDKILVKDNVSGQEYTLNKEFDKVYSLSFLDEYMKLIYVNEDTKYYVKEENGEKHEMVELTIPGTNPNMQKAILKINIKKLVPETIVVYDSKEKERIEINYIDFSTNYKIEDKLFR